MPAQKSSAPIVTEMLVIPVAGHDSMLLNLSGAHGPFFTRNVVILKDNSGRTGLGEVPGGEKIRQTLEESKPLVIGKSIGEQVELILEESVLSYSTPEDLVKALSKNKKPFCLVAKRLFWHI